MSLVTAKDVTAGQRIRIPGFGPEFHLVEYVDRAAPPSAGIDITVWPNDLDKPPFRQPTNEHESNGHFFADRIVTMNFVPNYPIEIDNEEN